MNVNISRAVRNSILALSSIGSLVTCAAQAIPPAAKDVATNLTARRTNLSLPDGKTVPMWGFCRTAHPTAPIDAGTCNAQWTEGPTITVPVGKQLTINLTNALPTPTSIVILGQLGGGVGAPKSVPSPGHATKTQTTWPANTAATVPFIPPAQAARVQSFGTETAPGGTQSYIWSGMKAGTYLYETGTNPSIQGAMGLYGVVVVTNEPVPALGSTPFVPGSAYPLSFPTSAKVKDVRYDADALLLLSEIDIVQNTAVDALCPVSGPCTSIDPMAYPPAVNYAPTYFLINGQPFSRTSPTGVPISSTTSSGNVLLRFVNAGFRTHIPSVVGLDMSLVAEDGNVLPGNPKVQNEVLLTAGKTYDVLVFPPTTTNATTHTTSYAAKSYGVFDRELSLSAGNTPDSGMQTFLEFSGAALPAGVKPQAVADTFTSPKNSKTFSGNVLLNDVAIYAAAIKTQPKAGNVILNPDGSFTYTSATTVVYPVTFSYCGNGSSTLCANVTIVAGADTKPIVAQDDNYTSLSATSLLVSRPGILANDTDPSGYPLTAKPDPAKPLPANITLNPDGSFFATSAGASTQTFTYVAANSQGTLSNSATVTVKFLKGSGLQLSVVDAQTKAKLNDYRWTIEEDVTFHNGLDVPTAANPSPNTIAVNFHKSYMPMVATGCVGDISCGAGQTMQGKAVAPQKATSIADIALDPNKYYYISILPGDASNAFVAASGAPIEDPVGSKNFRPFDLSKDCTPTTCGHTMGGVNISPGQLAATVLVEPNPLQTAQLSVFVFEDNNPTNGDIDGNEESQGLGGFQVILNDAAGRTGDPAGQITYDAFNMPLTNALMGTPDCPYVDASGKVVQDAKAVGDTLLGMVITCPNGINPKTHARYTLAGQALIKNLMPGRFDLLVNIGAGREAKGEKWHQVSTLEGTHANDAFAKSGEPTYFQEFGPPGYHAFVGFINEDNIQNVHDTLTKGLSNLHSITGNITNLHMSRPVNETLFSGSHDAIAQSTCFIGLNSQSGSGADVAFTKCDDKGNFTLSNIPDGAYQIVVWDDWLDLIPAYKDVTVAGQNVAMGDVPVFSWFTHLETTTFMDEDHTHLPDNNPGVSQVPFFIRFRDGSYSNKLLTDANGTATFNELFPLFNWYVIESDTTRFKGTKVHVVVDGGGKPDTSGRYKGILNSKYPTGESTERNDSGSVLTEGVQGFINQTQITDWGKEPYADGENGGINGTVVYSSTRPFDDPRYLFQNLWEPMIPGVTVRLYQETKAPDGTAGLTFIEETTTTSWDAIANATGSNAMKCPGQLANDPFVAQTIGTANIKKCYDGFHSFNQVQPAVYDGRYYFTKLPDGTPLPAGKYVVEMVTPPGYEVVKEEDKNILIGDAFVAPVSQQFGALTNIFIMPDQATVGAMSNPNNPNKNNTTANLGQTQGAVNFPACIGSTHRVPDFISLFPASGEVAPFAGADRPLCDRKEVILADRTQSNADFFLFTSAHIAAHYTGMILNDAASEANAASPDFGEKFAVPNVPISMKDFAGVEIQRTYADQWGNFNGLTPSSWQVNVPNPAGYSPNMLINCMNDPGPIPDPKHPGQMITDPNYNPMYSNFCYTNAFMPGLTDYLDTPVLPVAAFAAGYNQTDCAYPDATPAIKRVDSSEGFGPYLTNLGGTLTITALGDVTVPNPAYKGPSATTAPANQKTLLRHYGFGTQGPGSKITIGGVNVTARVKAWSDTSITLDLLPNTDGGQLVIEAANGKSTVDSVTVTIENRKPIRIQGSQGGTLQAAIDAATPGDLLLVDAGTYNELAIMWKPVRLQGVGAASVIINAAKYPTNKLELWRPQINKLFGIDAAGNQLPNAQVDPLPGQSITGGVVLLEPSVLGQEEGAGITVLAKNASQQECLVPDKAPNYISNFHCNPSRIDGVSVTGGDAGGGIFVNGWAHGIDIANNRVYGNAGSFHGGIRIGVPYLEDLGPGTLGFNKNVHIHHNSITNNGTIEANKGDSGAGGGVSMCSGTDNYRINYNFICGNFASTDGGGIGHIGVSDDAEISHNKILFNQSYAQTSGVHGGGIVIEGETPVGAGLSHGSGDVLVDSNLIQGNFAESGSGAGIRLQQVNGDEINRGALYKVTVTNNIIVNNVAGLAGAGIALADTVNSSIINNTIASNDSVGIVGALFTVTPVTASPNPAGVSSELISPQLQAVLSKTLLSADKKKISNPDLVNNIFWQNRSFFFDAFTGTAQECPSNRLSDAQSHTCSTTTPAYWDLGVVGDSNTTPGANHLNPMFSVITSTAGYGATNHANNPDFVAPYFNASTVAKGLLLPPEAYAAFATLDEGGNFVDMSYGPLTLTGDYRLASNSPAINAATGVNAPAHDYFGTARPQGPRYDVGAIEYIAAPQVATLTPGLRVIDTMRLIPSSSVQVVTLTNNSVTPLQISSIGFAGIPAQYKQFNNCGVSLPADGSCTITVVLPQTLLPTGRNPTLIVVDGAGTQSVTLGASRYALSASLSPNNSPAAVAKVSRAATGLITASILSDSLQR